MFRLRRFLKNYKLQLTLGPVCKLIEAIFELFIPLITADIIDTGVNQNHDVGYVLRQGGFMILLGAFGLGFCHVGGDLLDKCPGIGIMLKGGVEYMFSKHVGIGAELNDVLTFFGSNNTEYLRKIDPNDRSFISGTSRIELATGIRFYF